jgi:hypothetical protein
MLTNARRQYHYLAYLNASQLHHMADYFVYSFVDKDVEILQNILFFIHPNFTVSKLEGMELSGIRESDEDNQVDGEDTYMGCPLYALLCDLGRIITEASILIVVIYLL